ncbi:MAG TPA: chorismate synthase [Elusimicrobiota bacterium]|nr:chorismate synthase [Elusimicrobiota bacterium]HND63963.1 chorismate synthase [Elusimicrobiota bacterium]
MIRYLTAGESHGPCLTAVLEGVPAGLKITEDYLNQELHRRQYSFGRGERLQYIEKDTVKILSGVRWGETLGSPIAFRIENRDWENWEKIMSVDAADKAEKFRLTRPRPGHADLVGVLKYDRQDTRDILERASARETAARTAVGSVCKRLLEELGVKIYSWVVEIGGVVAKTDGLSIEESFSLAEKSPVRCPDKAAEEKMVEAIKEAKTNGDTLGGVYTVVVTGCPVGLGSHTHWDRKLDGKLAQAILSIQAHKGVEIGHGFGLARSKGSEVHDELFYQAGRGFYRKSNNAGGIEGGMTNGEPIVVRAAVKPLASLRRPLKSVNIQTKEEMTAEIVRSDVCPVASAAVVGETVVAIALAEAVSEKFGSDSIREMRDNRDRYTAHLLDY